MSESTDRTVVARALRSLHGVAVENPAHPGTPDVAFVGGWIEMKRRPRWPKRGGVVTMPHPVTPEQRIWISDHLEAGGQAWILLHIERDWILLHGSDAAAVGTTTREELCEIAKSTWKTKTEMESRISTVVAPRNL